MKHHIVITLIACASLVAASDLPRTAPESQGISSSAILEFIDSANKTIDSLHSFMLVRHGHVVAEGWWTPYAAQSPHALFSLSKSFTSTAVGLAVAEGKLSVDDEVLKFFPDDAPAEPDKNLKAMRVRDLLRMNTGHETEPPRPRDQSWKKAFLNHPVRFKPGTHFLYNTSGSYMLAAIVEKSTGMPLLDYLQPRLFQPLGIENPTWEKSPEGIATGGYGLALRTEDIARFGQLYLQKGKWDGKQLIPEAWIAEATSFQTSNGSSPKSDWDQGYGYQFWRCRHGAYRGDGAFGQYCVVMPEQDAVVAITGGLRDMQAVLNLVWEKLLPAMSTSALPPDGKNHEKLISTLKTLALPPQQGSITQPDLSKISGKTYRLPDNPRRLETIALANGKSDATTLIVTFNGAESRIEVGHNTWKKSVTRWGSEKPLPIAATGAWTSADTFTAKICITENAFIHSVTLRFSGNELRFNSEANVAFGATRDPELVATAVEGRP